MAKRTQETVWAVIAARKGSKRLRGKNTRLLAGKPMIAWTLDAALRSRLLDRLIVSTDDREIMRIARDRGVGAPFRRPSELCTDTASSVDVVRHAVAWMEHDLSCRPSAVVLLQPTSPLRSAADIDAAVSLLFNGGFNSVETFTEARETAAWQFRLNKNGQAKPLFPKLVQKSHKELEPFYAENGAVYAVRRDTLFRKGLQGTRHGGVVMPRDRSVDVDTLTDFLLAEALLQKGKP